MSHLIPAISTGITAFTATNLDDIMILLLLFSQGKSLFSHRHIVLGQYLGVITLVLISLLGFFGGLLLPQSWIGLLGLLPIAIGVNRLLNEDEDEISVEPSQTDSPLASLLAPQTYSVAAVTLANGSDNIGIYIPLFASCSVEKLIIILSVFFALIGVWCYAAYRLTRVPVIADLLTRYGNTFVPFVLIGLGLMILVESHTLAEPGLMILTLIISSIGLILVNCQNNQLWEIE